MSVVASAAGRARERSLLLPLALGTTYLVWGSTYLAIRVLVEHVPPLIAAGARFLLAGTLLYALLLVRGGRARVRVTAGELAGATLIGVLLLLGGNGLVSVAEQEAPSGLAALIIAAIPLWVIVLRLVARERVPGITLASVVVGFVGVGLLIAPGDRPDGAPLWSLVVLVFAALSWATGSYSTSRVTLPRDIFLSTAVQMLAGGAVTAVLGLVLGGASELDDPELLGWRSVAAFVYLVLAGSLLAFTAYVWLLQNAPISTVATYAFVNPVVAVLLGWAILSEEITSAMLAGAVVIVLSVALVVRREGGEAPTRSDDRAPAKRDVG